MRRSLPTKIIASVLALLMSGEAAVSSAAEAVWHERRHAARPVQMASLPKLPAPAPLATLSERPALSPTRLAFSSGRAANLAKALPASLGRLSVTSAENPRASVVLIEDIHRNEEAQRNIGQAVAALVDSGLSGVI